MKSRLPLLAGPLLLVTLGCSSNRLIFTTYTKLGIDVSASNGTTTGAMLGYKRFEGALIPVDPAKATGEAGDIGSVLAVLDFDNGWFQGMKLFQIFATGKAAEDAANDPSHISKLMTAWVEEKARGGSLEEPSAPKADDETADDDAVDEGTP